MTWTVMKDELILHKSYKISLVIKIPQIQEKYKMAFNQRRRRDIFKCTKIMILQWENNLGPQQASKQTGLTL